MSTEASLKNMDNVVSISEWKKNNKDKDSYSKYERYLSLLNAERIEIETRFLNELLDREPLEVDTLKKSKLLLNEVKSRLKSESPNKALSLNSMIDKISKKLDMVIQ